MGRYRMGYDSMTAISMFTAGKTVEVAVDNEDPQEVWVPATVLKYCGNSSFLVEYQKPGNGDQVVLHKATVDYSHIRPSPPHLRDKIFGLYEKVDVYYDYGWWSGVITKKLADNRYNVFFEHSKKERAFICSKIRPHMKWYDGKWNNKGLKIFEGYANAEATRSLITKQIEKTAPTIAKQSPDATSIMKRTKQTIPESNDIDSSPSKKMKNGAFMVDSSKKTTGISADQSEDLDSEFGKTENLSYGKKVGNTREKGIEQETPTMDCSKKKGKAANENESVNLDEGAKDDSDKTKSHESSEKDATKDLGPPVVTGLQCNEITISQAKIFKKCSNEIVPGVAEGDTKQLDAASEQVTVVEKEVLEENASTVAPKRKRGRPPKLRAKCPETPPTDNHLNEGVDPSAVPVLESAQMKEGSPASSGAKSLAKDQEPLKQDKLHNESQGQDLKAKRSRRKYSFGRRKRGKRRTISINTEAPVQDTQDSSEEKADENMETRKMDASVGKLLDTVSDDQPLSRLIDAVHSPIPIQNPASERRPEAVTCGMNAENLPFVKRTPLWHTIESMEAFQKIPQNPHFRPLLGVKESAREGMAIGTMVTFSTVVGKTCCLRVDCPRSAIEDCLETLVELESNGFDVEVIRDRLTRLLLLKDKKEELAVRSKGVVEKMEQNTQEMKIDDEVNEINRQIRQLEEERRKVLQKKEKWTLQNDAMKAAELAIEQELRELAAKFDGLAAAPL